MRWVATPFALSALSYLILGSWAIIHRKGKIHLVYGFFSIATCCWQSIWALLFSVPCATWLYNAIKLFYSCIVFLPPIFFVLIEEFTGHKNNKWWLWSLSGLTFVQLVAIWVDHLFINGYYIYSWGIAAKAGPLHPIFVIIVMVVIWRTLRMINNMHHAPSITDRKRRETNLVKWAIAIYCGGAIDLISQYGISIFPCSVFFSGIAAALICFAMFHYEFLKEAVLPESLEDLERRQSASEEMKKLGMTAAFPLVSQGEVLGYLLLGEKKSEESYSKEDLLLLRIVANQAALAYQRVRYLEMAVHGARTEMLGEIAGGFAHEIKTPLANISLPAELSLMDLLDLEKGKKKIEDILPELKERLEEIMQQTFKASEKIEAVRQFSKPGQVQMEAVDLSRVLQNSLGLLNHLLLKTNTKVRSEFPAVMSPIRGDAKQLEIVFVNLIKNATEAMAQHSSLGLARELWLKGHEDGNWVVTSVKDSGPGIKRTEFGHLFEAYFTTKGGEGTGMGLFLSRQVIKAHGGQIDVKSEEGKGTEFIIRLPKYVAQEHNNVHKAA